MPKKHKNVSISSMSRKDSIPSYELSCLFGSLHISPRFVCSSAMKFSIVTSKKKKRSIKNTIIVKILKYEEGLLLHIG